MDFESIAISAINTDGRIRKELGDIEAVAASIREFGLIQPIILAKSLDEIWLVAGGRRLLAIQQLGWQSVIHGKHFLWRDEDPNTDDGKLRLQAIELEENLRRKELSWSEIVLGKKRLLELMQSIHGMSSPGGRTREELRNGSSSGFGVRKLASMLGESVGQTSKDLSIADAITMIPQLAKSETKESAVRKMNIMIAVGSMMNSTKDSNVLSNGNWTLYEGNVFDNIQSISDNYVDLVYTDLPYGVNLDKMSCHVDKGVSYSDTRDAIVQALPEITKQSFRVLKDNRFAVFFFGFNYYTELLQSLRVAGFQVNPVPVIWYKHTMGTENPNTRYANAYDQAIVACKGSPVFIRPGRANVIDLKAVPSSEKLHVAQQPEALPENFILDMTAEGGIVLDLMAGSGTTGVAAIKNKRGVILFEQNKTACALIKARMSEVK